MCVSNHRLNFLEKLCLYPQIFITGTRQGGKGLCSENASLPIYSSLPVYQRPKSIQLRDPVLISFCNLHIQMQFMIVPVFYKCLKRSKYIFTFFLFFVSKRFAAKLMPFAKGNICKKNAFLRQCFMTVKSQEIQANYRADYRSNCIVS